MLRVSWPRKWAWSRGANVAKMSRLFGDHFELRFYGLAIGRFGVGMLRMVRVAPPEVEE